MCTAQRTAVPFIASTANKKKRKQNLFLEEMVLFLKTNKQLPIIYIILASPIKLTLVLPQYLYDPTLNPISIHALKLHLFWCRFTAFLHSRQPVNACHPPVPSSVEVTIELRRKPSWGRACACCLFWLRRLLNHSWILAIPVHAWLTCPRSVRQVRSYWLDEQNVGTQQLFYWLN